MHALPKSTVRKICSGQVVVDIVSAIKELVENSLDANPTTVEIVLENGGLDMFYVRDDGVGINREYLDSCCLRYYTSKLSSYEELQYLGTLGFRGEALNSLCSVSSKVEIISKTKEDEIAIKATFNSAGKLIDTEENYDFLEHGTEVKVKGIFEPFPVRLEVQKSKLKQSERQVKDLIIAFSLIHPKIKFTLTPIGKPQFVSQSVGTISEAISNVFGPTLFSQLQKIESIAEDFISDDEDDSGTSSQDAASQLPIISNTQHETQPSKGEATTSTFAYANSPLAALRQSSHLPSSKLSKGNKSNNNNDKEKEDDDRDDIDEYDNNNRDKSPSEKHVPQTPSSGSPKSPIIVNTSSSSSSSGGTTLSPKSPKTSLSNEERQYQLHVEAYIPKNSNHSSIGVVARSSNDRCFLYVNKRLVDLPGVSKSITRAYRAHIGHTSNSRYPFMLVNITMPSYTYDINVNPDKRKVFFHNEMNIITLIQKMLARTYLIESIDRFARPNKFPTQRSPSKSPAASNQHNTPQTTPSQRMSFQERIDRFLKTSAADNPPSGFVHHHNATIPAGEDGDVDVDVDFETASSIAKKRSQSNRRSLSPPNQPSRSSKNSHSKHLPRSVIDMFDAEKYKTAGENRNHQMEDDLDDTEDVSEPMMIVSCSTKKNSSARKGGSFHSNFHQNKNFSNNNNNPSKRKRSVNVDSDDDELEEEIRGPVKRRQNLLSSSSSPPLPISPPSSPPPPISLPSLSHVSEERTDPAYRDLPSSVKKTSSLEARSVNDDTKSTKKITRQGSDIRSSSSSKFEEDVPQIKGAIVANVTLPHLKSLLDRNEAQRNKQLILPQQPPPSSTSSSSSSRGSSFTSTISPTTPLKVIGVTSKPEIFVVIRDNLIYLTNAQKAEEAMVFHSLCSECRLPCSKPLPSPLLINEQSIMNDECWNLLLHHYSAISKSIQSNGFLLSQSSPTTFEISAVTSLIDDYGIDDFKELLELLVALRHSEATSRLSISSLPRPKKVLQYFAREAVRISLLGCPSPHQLQEFLNKIHVNDVLNCPHNKPVYELIYTISPVSPSSL